MSTTVARHMSNALRGVWTYIKRPETMPQKQADELWQAALAGAVKAWERANTKTGAAIIFGGPLTAAAINWLNSHAEANYAHARYLESITG